MKHLKVSTVRFCVWGSHAAECFCEWPAKSVYRCGRASSESVSDPIIPFLNSLEALVLLLTKPELFGQVHKRLHSLSSDPWSDCPSLLQHKGRAEMRHTGNRPG